MPSKRKAADKQESPLSEIDDAEEKIVKPKPKRVKAPKGCAECRKVRTKCEGSSNPPCTRCASNNLTCADELQPTGEPKGLEELTAWAKGVDVRLAQITQVIDRILAHLHSQQTPAQQTRVLTPPPSASPNRYAAPPSHSQAYQDHLASSPTTPNFAHAREPSHMRPMPAFYRPNLMPGRADVQPPLQRAEMPHPPFYSAQQAPYYPQPHSHTQLQPQPQAQSHMQPALRMPVFEQPIPQISRPVFDQSVPQISRPSTSASNHHVNSIVSHARPPPLALPPMQFVNESLPSESTMYDSQGTTALHDSRATTPAYSQERILAAFNPMTFTTQPEQQTQS